MYIHIENNKFSDISLVNRPINFSSFKITFSSIIEVVLETFKEQKRGRGPSSRHLR